MAEATDWVKCRYCNHYQVIPILTKDSKCEKCKNYLKF
jgi:hypothetical protein